MLGVDELVCEISQKYILHWNYRGFTQLPKELQLGEKVEEIYLKWNKLSCLPSWISKLKNLTNLYLQHNMLRSLPQELSELSQLTVLDVSNNQIKVLPSGLGRLSCLIQFSAAHNRVHLIPDDFQMLKSLQILDLSQNNLTTFPMVILECSNLQELLLDNNKLTSLPDNIVYLPNLVNLSVSDNDLCYLPLQPFLSNPFLNFENNPNLNYLSIWLGQQISNKSGKNMNSKLWNLPGADGCFHRIRDTSSGASGDIKVMDELSDKEQVLTLPPTLKEISSGSNCQCSVAPLLELALRKVYTLCCCHSITEYKGREESTITIQRIFPSDQYYLRLPLLLRHQLNFGPVTFCYYCHEFIFGFGVVWLISKDCYIDTQRGYQSFHVLSTIFFCSVACSTCYAQWERKSTLTDKLETKKLQWCTMEKHGELDQ